MARNSAEYNLFIRFDQTSVFSDDFQHQLIVKQGRSEGGYIGIYTPPKSVYLTNFYVVTGCFSLFDPGQIRYCANVRLSSCFFYLLTTIYTPPNEIPGYARLSRSK